MTPHGQIAVTRLETLIETGPDESAKVIARTLIQYIKSTEDSQRDPAGFKPSKGGKND